MRCYYRKVSIGLNRTYSLKRHKEFRYTYRAGKAVSCRLFTLVYVANRRAKVQIGLSVSKKIGNSVQRNRAKRRLRASLSPMLTHVAPGWNLIFIAREEVLTCSFLQMQCLMQQMIRKAGLWRDEP